MESLTEILFMLSTALLAPVIVLLLAATAWTLLEVGGFLFEWRQRRSGAAGGMIETFQQQAQDVPHDALQLERIVTDLELTASARIARMYLGVRLGPMLGLMGTLIPLGPALMGLVDMNIALISRNLFVGFATTVLGLLIGGFCYVMAAVRRQWYARDLADVEYLAASLLQPERQNHASANKSPNESHRRPSPSVSGR
jgi:biopolymer transport protein ExbB/TolQ